MRDRASLTMRAAAVLLAAVVFASSAYAGTGRRVALVIGNSAYPSSPLSNPANDARAIAAKLKELGFDVILRENASKTTMEDAIGRFGEKLSPDSTGLMFYAGHGMQVGGHNYLLPVDAKISTEQRVKLEAIDAEVVLDQMAAAHARVSLLILDACRNNPFERRWRGGSAGLAQMNAPEGTMIGYATAPGKVASDGEDSNGLYTENLLKVIGTPGLAVEEIFKRVRVAVSRASNGDQVPWESSSLTGDFYFVAPPAGGAPEAMRTQPVKAAPDPTPEERGGVSYVMAMTTQALADPDYKSASVAILREDEIVTGCRSPDEAKWACVISRSRQAAYVSPATVRRVDETSARDWEKIKDSKEYDEFDAFAHAHPNTFLAARAEAKSKYLYGRVLKGRQEFMDKLFGNKR